MNLKQYPVIPYVVPPLTCSLKFRLEFIINIQNNTIIDLKKSIDDLTIKNIGSLKRKLAQKNRLSEIQKVRRKLIMYQFYLVLFKD